MNFHLFLFRYCARLHINLQNLPCTPKSLCSLPKPMHTIRVCVCGYVCALRAFLCNVFCVCVYLLCVCECLWSRLLWCFLCGPSRVVCVLCACAFLLPRPSRLLWCFSLWPLPCGVCFVCVCKCLCFCDVCCLNIIIFPLHVFLDRLAIWFSSLSLPPPARCVFFVRVPPALHLHCVHVFIIFGLPLWIFHRVCMLRVCEYVCLLVLCFFMVCATNNPAHHVILLCGRIFYRVLWFIRVDR